MTSYILCTSLPQDSYNYLVHSFSALNIQDIGEKKETATLSLLPVQSYVEEEDLLCKALISFV